jgi:hypothetical protein
MLKLLFDWIMARRLATECERQAQLTANPPLTSYRLRLLELREEARGKSGIEKYALSRCLDPKIPRGTEGPYL